MQRGQAAPHRLHLGAAAAAEGGVPAQPVPHGAAEAESGPGPRPQRVPDQDLVSEQACQDQEGLRREELPGAPPDGAGTLQPLHDQGRQV